MQLDDSKILLVLGDTGFIGRNFIEFVLENYNIRRIVGISHRTFAKIEHEKYVHIRLELLNDEISKIISYLAPDVICHFASQPRIGCYVFDDFTQDILATKKILDAAAPNSTILFSSSSAVYGKPNSRHRQWFEETSRCNPISLYGIAKCTIEQLISKFAADKGIRPIICRLVSQVGKYSTHGVVHDIINKVMSSEHKTIKLFGNEPGSCKPFMYVGETCKLMCELLETAEGGIYNISPLDAVNVKDIVKIIKLAASSDKPIEWTGENFKDDVEKFYMSSRKLEIELSCYNRKINTSSYEAVEYGVKEIFHEMAKTR